MLKSTRTYAAAIVNNMTGKRTQAAILTDLFQAAKTYPAPASYWAEVAEYALNMSSAEADAIMSGDIKRADELAWADTVMRTVNNQNA